MLDFFTNLDQLFQYLDAQPVWWGLVILGLSAMIEYIVPPFPGDTVTLVGAVLIPNADWPVLGVFAAVMVGTAVGAAFDWRVGLWLAQTDNGDTWLHRWMRRESVKPKIDKLIDQFERHGPVYIVLNRFVPAFRALFFVAAGLAKLDLGKTLLWGCLGAALWNGIVLGAGYAVGYNLDKLAVVFGQYSRIFWIVVCVLVALWGARVAWRWLRR